MRCPASGSGAAMRRTPDDVALPGSPDHPRGWFFEVFPRLLDVENGRRRTAEAVTQELTAGGLASVSTSSLEEVRRRYDSREDYLTDIRARTGRSLLHDVDDAELDHLVVELRRRLPQGPVVERDRWTVWVARRPADRPLQPIENEASRIIRRAGRDGCPRSPRCRQEPGP